MPRRVVVHLDDSLYERCKACMHYVHADSKYSFLPCPSLSAFLPLLIEYACLEYEFEVFGKEPDIDAK